MINAEPDWSLYRTFLAVLREGSFSAAARSIGSTQPTVGRQMEALEERLQTKLFTRSQRGLAPTAAAQDLLPHAEAMAAAAAALHRVSSAERSEERGTVRLTAAELMGIEVLPPILSAFSRSHPHIAIELSLSNRNEDLLQRDADIAVRMARPAQNSLLARRVGTVKVGLFAHRAYVEAYGLPKTPDDFSKHRLIGFDRDTHVLRTSGGPAAALQHVVFNIRTDSVAAQQALLRAGAGITACQINAARRDPDLVAVPTSQFVFTREIWIVMHPDMKRVHRIRLLFDHLVGALTKYAKE
jgi:DNA-binding transcriptional LysR family regulator